MGFSPLADMARRIPDVGRSSPRQARVSGFTIHHNAGVDAFGQATAAGREVSAQYWITNGGVILPNIDENRRAWTTGAAGYPAGAESDHRNITVEVSNSPEGVRDGTWAISAAAEEALSALIGDVFRRYNLGPVRRAAVGGVAVHQDFVPTQCPGNFIMANLGRIIDRANDHSEDDMTPEQSKKLDAIYDAIFTTSPTSRGTRGGILKTLKAIDDAQFKTEPTTLGTPGGTLVNDRTMLEKLDAITDHLGIETGEEPE